MEEEKLVKNDEEIISKEEFLKIKRDNNRNKAIIAVLTFAMLLMIILVVLYFINGAGKDPKDKQPDNNQPTPVVTPTPTPANNNENKVYKSKDGAHTLIIINKQNSTEYNKAAEKYKSIMNKEVTEIGEIVTLGYYDDVPIVITRIIKEDDTYVSITGSLAEKNEGMCGPWFVYIYNKKTNKIEYPINGVSEIDIICVHELSFVKIGDKYFFTKTFVETEEENYDITIYSTDWKLIGYAKGKIEYSSDGFYYYENSDYSGEKMNYQVK